MPSFKTILELSGQSRLLHLTSTYTYSRRCILDKAYSFRTKPIRILWPFLTFAHNFYRSWLGHLFDSLYVLYIDIELYVFNKAKTQEIIREDQSDKKQREKKVL